MRRINGSKRNVFTVLIVSEQIKQDLFGFGMTNIIVHRHHHYTLRQNTYLIGERFNA